MIILNNLIIYFIRNKDIIYNLPEVIIIPKHKNENHL